MKKKELKNFLKISLFVVFLVFLFSSFTPTSYAFDPFTYLSNIYQKYTNYFKIFQPALVIKTTTTEATKNIAPSPVVAVDAPFIPVYPKKVVATPVVTPTVNENTLLPLLQKLLSNKEITDKLRGPQGVAGPKGDTGASGANGGGSLMPAYFGVAQPNPSTNYSGATMLSATNLSSNVFTTTNANVSNLSVVNGVNIGTYLNVSNNATFGGDVIFNGSGTFSSGTGELALNGSATFNKPVTANDTVLFTHIPTLAHAFSPAWPLGTSNITDAALLINPTSTVADGNLIAASVAGLPKFIVDAEGDIYANNLILTGSTSSGSTAVGGNLSVQDNTILGDASTDTVTFNANTLFIPNNLNIDAGTFFLDSQNHNVGIGTTVPATALEVNGIVTATGGNSTNWNIAYSQTRQWNGGSTGLNATTGRASLGLGSAAQNNTGDFLAYNGTATNSSLLENHNAAYFQTALTNPVTGTGTTNYLPKFTGASTLGNSSLSDDGSNITSTLPVLAKTLRLSGTSPTITNASNTTPIVVTAVAHGLITGDTISVSGITGNTHANGYFKIIKLSNDTFSLQDYSTGADIAGNGTYGGTPLATVGVLQAGQVMVSYFGNSRPNIASQVYPTNGLNIASTTVGLFVGGVQAAWANNNAGLATNNGGLALNNGNVNTYMISPASAVTQLGQADSNNTAVAQTLQVQSNITGTNLNAPASFTIKAPAGTGTGTGGKLIFQAPVSGTTGTTAHTQNTILTLQDSGTGGTSAPQAIFGVGSSAGPSISFAGDPTTGFFWNSSGTVQFSGSGSGAVQFDNSNITLPVSNALRWSSDLYLKRFAAATLQLGVGSATPISQTIQSAGSRGGTDTDIAGANLTIRSGAGTGAAVGSSLIFQTPATTTSGTTAQTQTERMRITGAGNVGIGTTAPASLLHVKNGASGGTFSNDTGMIFETSGSSASYSALRVSTTGAINAFSVTNAGSVGIGMLPVNPGNKLDILDTTLAGSGSLAGSVLNLNQTWNTTGAPTAIKLNVTNTASDAASLLMDLQVGGSSVFSVSKGGSITSAGGLYVGANKTAYIDSVNSNSSSGTLYLNTQASSAINRFAVSVAGGDFSQASGTNGALTITPTYNQTGGSTAANTDLLINRTQTAVGSGSQNLIDAQVGSVSKFSVSNVGLVTLAERGATYLPQIVGSSDNTTGLSFLNGSLFYSSGSVARFSVDSTKFKLHSTQLWSWASTDINSASDTFMSRGGVATLQLGAANSATPVAQTLQAQGSRGGTDTDIAGGSLTIQSGAGTGAAVGSSLIFQTPLATTSGTTAQTQTERMRITGAGNVGIGTTNPTDLLQINKDGDNYLNVTAQTGTGQITGIKLQRGAWGTDAYNDWRIYNSGGSLTFETTYNNVTLGALQFDASGNVSLANGGGAVNAGGTISGAKFSIQDSTFAGSSNLAGSLLSMAQTWNTTGAPTAIKLNVTNAASDAASSLMDLQVDSGTKFKVSKSGVVTSSGYIAGSYFLQNGNSPSYFSVTGNLLGSSTTSGYAVGLYNANTFTNTTGSRQTVAILPTYNQATGTASNTDLLINRTETAVGSGAQLLIDAQVGGVSKFKVDNTGSAVAQSYAVINDIVVGYAGTDIYKNSRSNPRIVFSNTKNAGVSVVTSDDLIAGAASYGLKILPTYNQVSGAATNTDLLINRTETAVGSGAQYLIDAQVGGASKFRVDNTGALFTSQVFQSLANYAAGYAFEGSNGSMSRAYIAGLTRTAGGAVPIDYRSGSAADKTGGYQQWTIDGSAKMILDNSGNVGIGTTTPGALLHINGGTIKVVSNGDKFAFYEDDVAEATAYVKLSNSTTTPTSFNPVISMKSNILNNAYSNSIVADSNNDTATSGPLFSIMARVNDGVVTNRALFSVDNYYNNSKFRILANGNVGIGTTNPESIFQVGDGLQGVDSMLTFKSGDNKNAGLIMGEGTGTYSTGLGYGFRMFYDGASSNYFKIQSMEGAGFVDRLAINRTTGNVGIGTTSPAQKLSVLGAAGDTAVLSIATTSGNTCTFTTVSGTFSCVSDERLKNEITSIGSADALTKLSSLNPVTFHYNWQNITDPLVSGFLAQEFEKVFPELVTTDPVSGYKSLTYAPLMPYAISAIQELNLNLNSIAGTVTPLAGSTNETFVTAFFDNVKTKIGAWLADATNGIVDIFANKATLDQICLKDANGTSCYNRTQLDSMLSGAAAATTPPVPAPTLDPTPAPEVPVCVSPQVLVNNVCTDPAPTPVTTDTTTSTTDTTTTTTDTSPTDSVPPPSPAPAP